MDFSAFSGPAFWAALLSIIVANILLSGDNAVVIALASRNLPSHQQKKAIFWGSAAAIILRVVLTVTAVQLLTLPYLKIIGAILLLYIGVQLLADSGEEEEMAMKISESIYNAKPRLNGEEALAALSRQGLIERGGPLSSLSNSPRSSSSFSTTASSSSLRESLYDR